MAGDSWHSLKIIHPRYRGWSGSNKKKPPMGLRADSFECDVTSLIRGLWLYFWNQIAQNSHLDDSCVFSSAWMIFSECHESPALTYKQASKGCDIGVHGMDIPILYCNEWYIRHHKHVRHPTWTPHLHNHEILGKFMIGYSRITLSHAKGGAWPRWIAYVVWKPLYIWPQWDLDYYDLEFQMWFKYCEWYCFQIHIGRPNQWKNHHINWITFRYPSFPKC